MRPGSTRGEHPTEELLARAAAGLTGEEREAFLRLCCVGDPDLRAVINERLEGGTLIDTTATIEGDGGGAESEEKKGGRLKVPVEGEGSVIGPYRLFERVGEGGMGEVYRAEQSVPLRRVVAFKLLKLGLNSRLVVARFEAERQALAMMDHPGIARVFDAGSTPLGRPYFVMEYVAGVPLTTHCDCDRLGLRERLRLFVEICRAVQHAHQKGIIHRDLKPSNILVAEAEGGGGASVKVIDFGIAKATGGRLTDQTIATGYLQLLGTPAYMAPEQIGGMAADVDTRCDIYALGGVLYELLTGTTPIDATTLAGASPAELERILREEEPEAPSARVRGLGPVGAAVACYRGPGGARRLEGALKGDLDWITLKALAKERERRYGTADELAADVLRHLRHEPVLAGPPTARYKLGKFARRHRGALVMSSLLLAALAAGLAASAWQAEKAIAAGATAVHARDRGEELIEFMLTDLEAKLSPVGRTELLEAVGDEVMEYYEEFDVATESPKALSVRSEAFLRIAQVKSAKGTLAEAEAVVERALEIRRALAEREPGVAGEAYRHGVALGLAARGDIRRNRGNLAAADADYAAAAATLRSTGGASAPPKRQVERVRVLNRWAETRRERGDSDRGNAALKEAREVIEALKEAGFYTEAVENQEGINKAEMGVNSRLEGDLEGAQRLFGEAIVIWRRRLEEDPRNVSHRAALAYGLENLGQILIDEGDYGAALEAVKEAEAGRLSVASLDPENGNSQFKLAANRTTFAHALVERGELDQAEEKLALAGAALDELIRRDASNTLAREMRGVGHFYSGVVEHKRGRAAEARDHFDRAGELFDGLIEDLRRSDKESGALHRRWFAHRTASRAAVVRHFDPDLDPDLAAEGLKASLELHGKLVELDPDDVEAQMGLALTYRALGEVEARRGNLSGMRSALGEAVGIFDRLAVANPTNAFCADALVNAITVAADLEKAAGATAEARSHYRHALSKAIALVESLEGADEVKAHILSYACANLLEHLGDDAAEADRLRIMAVARSAARMHPADDNITAFAGHATILLAGYFAQKGDPGRAAQVLKGFISEWAVRPPARSEVIWERLLGTANGLLGFRLKELGKGDEARGHFAEALRLAELRVRRNPSGQGERRKLFSAHHNYGVSLWEAGDFDAAIHHYREALRREDVLGDGARWMIGRIDLAGLYHGVVERSQGAGDAAGAWAALIEMTRVRAEICDITSGSIGERWELAKAYRRLAEAAREQAREPEAVAAARLAGAVLWPMAADGDGRALDVIGELTALYGTGEGASPAAWEPAVAAGSTWRYHSSREGPGAGWREVGFDDSGWPEGPAQLGYGDGDEATEIPFGPEAEDKFIAAYFRHRFELPPAPAASGWILRVLCDDGAAVYLDGEEVARINLPGGALGQETRAPVAVAGEGESNWQAFDLPPDRLLAGAHTVAAEVHQHNGTSTDLSFDLELRPRPRVQLEPILTEAARLGLPVPTTLGYP